MKRKIFVFLAISLISLKLFAQNSQLRVGLLNGPTCLPAAYLMDNSDYSFQQFADPQALLPKMIKKEIDVGFMPANVAAKVYNSASKVIVCTAVVGLGNLKLITTDQNIRNFTDLKGKTVYVAGQGASPEYIFRYLLKENGMTWQGDRADVKMDFSIPTAQLAAQLISGKIAYALLPEPFATIAQMKSDQVKCAIDLQNEYLAVTGEKEIYPLSVMVVRSDFAKENPELLKNFLSEYQHAVNKAVSNPTETGRLCEKHMLGLAADVVENAVPISNYVYEAADLSKKNLEFLLNLFLENDKASIGGKLPDKDFYYSQNEEN